MSGRRVRGERQGPSPLRVIIPSPRPTCKQIYRGLLICEVLVGPDGPFHMRLESCAGTLTAANSSLLVFSLCSTAMNTSQTYRRSPELMSAEDTVLLVVDVQVKLMPLMRGQGRIFWNLRRLLDGAEATGVKALATEQYPQGLGPTVPELAGRLGDIPSKAAFSCGGCEPFVAELQKLGPARCWSRASRPTSACSRRCSICWRAVTGSICRSMPSDRAMRSTTKRACGGWNRPAPR